MRQTAQADVLVFTLAQLSDRLLEKYNVCKYSRNCLFQRGNSVFSLSLQSEPAEWNTHTFSKNSWVFTRFTQRPLPAANLSKKM